MVKFYFSSRISYKILIKFVLFYILLYRIDLIQNKKNQSALLNP